MPLPAPSPEPPVAEPSPQPPVAVPPSGAGPSEASPLAPPAASVVPAVPPLAAAPVAAPPTGSAAFAPLPEERAKPRPHASPAAPTPPAPSPLAADETQLDAPLAPINHQDEPEKEDDGNGVFGPFRIGGLVGGGLPELLSLGGQIKLTRFFGAGINVGLIPTVKLSFYGEAKISYQEYDAYGRVYPFGGSFFLGTGVGYATIKGTVNGNISTSAAPAVYRPFIPDPILLDSQGSVRTLVLTPQLGFMKIFGSGFTIGVDVGAQLPLAPSKADFATNTPNLQEPAKTYVQSTYIKPNDDKVRSTLDTIGRTPLPSFNLKIGWFL